MRDLTRHLTLVGCLAGSMLLVACGGGDDGPPPTATSAPAGPTLAPLPTLPPEATPTPVAAHPPGERTGVDVIDRVIEAVESGDPARLRDAVSFHPFRCDNEGVEGSKACPPGVAEGTPLDVVAAGSCEAALLARDTREFDEAVNVFLTAEAPRALNPSLYAAVEVEPNRLASPLPIRYMLIFASGHTLILDDAGITHFGFPCEGRGAAALFHPADRAILPPP